MAYGQTGAYRCAMRKYELTFFGGTAALPAPVQFEALSNDIATDHANLIWESGTYTTSAKGFQLHFVDTGDIVRARERANA